MGFLDKHIPTLKGKDAERFLEMARQNEEGANKIDFSEQIKSFEKIMEKSTFGRINNDFVDSKIMINTQISLLRKEIKDLEAQRVMLKLLIKEYTDKAETLRNMTWKPNFVPGTDELHFNKWKSFSIAANKKALNELVRQAKSTVKHLKFLQKDLTQLSLINEAL